MGLFSSKHVFTAYAGSSSLIDEDDRNSTVLQLMLQAGITTESSMAEAVKLGLQTDLMARAKSMVRYALRDDGYFYGLPEPTHTYREYLPIVPLMHDRKWFDEVGNDELEKTTKRILKRLALKADDIKEEYIAQVEEGIASGDRPGTDQLDDWDFFIQFGVPMHTITQGSRDYIWNYLQFLEQYRQWTWREEYLSFLASGQSGEQPHSSFRITEGEGSSTDWEAPSPTGYAAWYSYSYIESVTYSGVYTPPGWTEPLRSKKNYSKIYRIGDSDYAEGIIEVHGEGATVATSEPEGTYHTYAVFTKQNSDETYTQVLIMAPSMMYVINTTEGASPELQYIDVPLFPDDPEEDSEFRWPVMYESLKEVSAMRREECLQEALCATVFLVEHIKVKWYQKTFFKWLIVIIVIIIVILTRYYNLLGTVKGMAATAVGVGATGTAIAFAALYVAMIFALGFLISFAGSLIGGRAGQLFVIAATLYMAGVNPFSNIGNTWGNLVTTPGFGSAMSFIQAVQPILTVAQIGYSAYETDKLEDQMKDFLETARDKYDALRDAYDMIGPTPAGLDPMFITSIFTGHWNERPESFYARTLNANPGILGYDLINDFSEIALTLPEDSSDLNIIDTMMESFARQRGAV